MTLDDLFFRSLVNMLLGHAENKRDQARSTGAADEGDRWSAIAGHLDNARQRMR